MRQFSLKMRKAAAKKEAARGRTKYKLKTKKAAQKRFRVVGALRDKAFKYHAVGHRHLNRNKTKMCLRRKKTRHTLKHAADARKMKKLLPYFKKRRSLRC